MVITNELGGKMNRDKKKILFAFLWTVWGWLFLLYILIIKLVVIYWAVYSVIFYSRAPWLSSISLKWMNMKE